MIKYSLGIDMASKKFDACLSVIDASQKVTIKASRQFSNNLAGFKDLVNWVNKNHKQKEIRLVTCMEATGIYYEQCALFLNDLGFCVSVILPNKAKKYLQSLGLKSKTDSIDAKGLAQMGAEQNLNKWNPMGEYFYLLRSLTRQLQNIQELKTVATNQLHSLSLGMYEMKFVIKQQKKIIAEYDKMIVSLNATIVKHIQSNEVVAEKVNKITAIKGVGLLTVAVLLAETNGFELFTSTSQLVSFSGYDVVENQSGNHRGKTKISKKGNSRIRRALFMPAFSSVRYNESVLKNLYERVFERSRIKMKAYVAVQKKLLVLIYSLWKNDEIFISNLNNIQEEEQEQTSLLGFEKAEKNSRKLIATTQGIHPANDHSLHPLC
jgi:transposase